METIFDEHLENKLKNQPKLLLRVNAEMKKLGFSKIKPYDDVSTSTFFEEELVFIDTCNYNDDYYFDGDFKSELSKLNGYSTDYLRLRDIPTGAIEWKIGDLTVGFYHKERNYFLSFYPFLGNSRINIGQKNEIIPYFINKLKEFGEDFEVVDVSDIGKKIIAEKFNEVWVKRGRELGNMIDRAGSDIISYQKDLKSCYDNLKLHQKEKYNVESQLGKGMDKVSEVLKKMDNSKAIKSIKIENNYIVVEYGDIYIRYNGKDLYIGDFMAKIGTGELEIINKNPVYKVQTNDDMKAHRVDRIVYHPHINGDSGTSICFGSARGTDISKFKSDLEYDKVAYLILLFLKTYTESDGGYERIYPWENIVENDGKRYYIIEDNQNDGDEE